MAYLAYYAGRHHSRELLTELLWPDDEVDSARHKLSVALSWIRQHLEPPEVPDQTVVVADRLRLSLNHAAVRTDVAEFEQALHFADNTTDAGAREQWLLTAVNLYQGPLLPGFYEDWILPEQRRLEALYFEGVRRLIPLLEQSGQLALALQVVLQSVSVDPLREENHRQAIRLFWVSGQPEAALRQYDDLTARLREELNTQPSEETRRLAAEVRRSMGGNGRLELPNTGNTPTGTDPAKAPSTPEPSRAHQDLDPVGGAVPLDSPFYLVRGGDEGLHRSLDQHTSIVLIKGARQVGKTSLLARGLQHARATEVPSVYTDLQVFNAEQLRSADSFLLAVARVMAEQLEVEPRLDEIWNPEDGPNINFRRFMRRTILEQPGRRLFWALDNADRLFSCAFGTEVFALMRAWHNERALDPRGPWSGLTLAIAYATEAHLFITDVNQSPFNVGTRLMLDDFSLDQVGALNRKYGSPLRDPVEIRMFWDLVGGHPFLTRRGLLELSLGGGRLAALEARADHDDGVFGEHLRRVRGLLVRDPALCRLVRQVLDGKGCPDANGFYRLRSAGVLCGDTAAEARPRCRLYSRYLNRYLPAEP